MSSKWVVFGFTDVTDSAFNSKVAFGPSARCELTIALGFFGGGFSEFKVQKLGWRQ